MSSFLDKYKNSPIKAEEEIKSITEEIIAIHEHEGVTPSDLAITCGEKLLRGEINSEEAISLILSQ